MRYKDLELLVDTVVDKEVVRHTNTMGLHRMSRSIIVITDLTYMKEGLVAIILSLVVQS